MRASRPALLLFLSFAADGWGCASSAASPKPEDGPSDVSADGVRVERVYLAQTHVLEPDDPLFGLVGERPALLKAQVLSDDGKGAPPVVASLRLGEETLELPLKGPASLPKRFVSEKGKVEHRLDDSFTATLPGEWVRPGLRVAIQAGKARWQERAITVGAPTTLEMTMFDIYFFERIEGDYPAGFREELAAKLPVRDIALNRVRDIVFPSLIIPPRGGLPAVKVTSKESYMQQTGAPFDGEQAAGLQWNKALANAAGKAARLRLFFSNLYGVVAGGQAGGFRGVGGGTEVGVLHHELGHALSLPHWSNDPDYPYKGDMFGIPANPDNPWHAGPTWAFDPLKMALLPPTVQPGSEAGFEPGTYKADPMQGGGRGDQESGYLLRHFSDYSVHKIRDFLERNVVVWNTKLGSYAVWDGAQADYAAAVSGDDVNYPVERNVEVVSLMAAVSAATPAVTMVYPPVGPYRSDRVAVYDPRNAEDRAKADQRYCPEGGCDVTLSVTQGGKQSTYLLPVDLNRDTDPLSGSSLQTVAINLPAADGEVTKASLLRTPNAEKEGLPAAPSTLATWTR